MYHVIIVYVFQIAMPVVKCSFPGCAYVTDDQDVAIVIELLKIHSTCHTTASTQSGALGGQFESSLMQGALFPPQNRFERQAVHPRFPGPQNTYFQVGHPGAEYYGHPYAQNQGTPFEVQGAQGGFKGAEAAVNCEKALGPQRQSQNMSAPDDKSGKDEKTEHNKEITKEKQEKKSKAATAHESVKQCFSSVKVSSNKFTCFKWCSFIHTSNSLQIVNITQHMVLCLALTILTTYL